MPKRVRPPGYYEQQRSYRLAKRAFPLIRQCTECGTEFKPYRAGHLVCGSPECKQARAALVQPYVPVTKSCVICGRDITGIPLNKVCSEGCRRELNSRNQVVRKLRHDTYDPIVVKQCVICGGDFTSGGDGKIADRQTTAITCSDDCNKVLRAIRQSERQQARRTFKNCVVCGDRFFARRWSSYAASRSATRYMHAMPAIETEKRLYAQESFATLNISFLSKAALKPRLFIERAWEHEAIAKEVFRQWAQLQYSRTVGNDDNKPKRRSKEELEALKRQEEARARENILDMISTFHDGSSKKLRERTFGECAAEGGWHTRLAAGQDPNALVGSKYKTSKELNKAMEATPFNGQ